MMNLTSGVIQDHWPLNDVVIGKELQRSGDRVVVSFKSAQGEYVYKRAPKGRTLDAVKRDLLTLEFVNQIFFGFAPRLLRTTSEQDCEIIDGQVTYILERVGGERPRGTVKDWQALGHVTGLLHQLPKGPVDTSFTQASVLPDLLLHSHKFPFQAEYDQLIHGLADIEDLPKAVIHTDIGLHNCIRSADSRYVLVDWDDAGNGVRLLDIAFPLLNAFIDSEHNFQHAQAKAFYSAYATHIRLTENEKQNLFSAALFYVLMYMEFGEIAQKWEILRNQILPEKQNIEQTVLQWL